ncbi:MAG: hypothetical protein QW298_00365, partial [Candidatus Micrarchaeaceae archaeon]
IASTLLKSIEFDEKNREKITAEEYKKIRIDENFDRIKPMIADTGGILQNDIFAIDRTRIANYFGRLKSISVENGSIDIIKNVARQAHPEHRMEKVS